MAEVAHPLALEGRDKCLAHAFRAREPEPHRRPSIELNDIKVHASGEQPSEQEAKVSKPGPR